MRYRWVIEDQTVMDAWDDVCRKRYKDMMNKAKTIYKTGLQKRVPVLQRPKWMEPPYFFICKKRWDNDKEVKHSRQMAKNRGVVFDENNNVVSRAQPTWYGGNIGLVDRCPQVSDEGDASCLTRAKKLKVRQVNRDAVIDKRLPMVFKITRIANRAELRAREEARAAAELVSENGNVTNIPDVEEKWVNEPAKELYEEYTHATKELESSDGSVTEFNPALWSKFAGGYQHGRVRGVSHGVSIREVGFVNHEGRVFPPRPLITSQVDPAVVLKMKEELNTLKKSQEENKKMKKQMKAMKKSQDKLLAFFNNWRNSDASPAQFKECMKEADSIHPNGDTEGNEGESESESETESESESDDDDDADDAHYSGASGGGTS